MSGRRSIAFLIPTLAPGGTERQLIYLAESLGRSHDVRVICTGAAGLWAGRMACRVTALNCRGGWDPRTTGRVYAALKEEAPDVVHSFMFGFDHAVNAAARRAEVPVIVSSRRQLATWKRPRHIRLQRQANTMADAIVANAQAVADFAAAQEKSESGNYRVIYNGIEPERFQCTDTPEQVRSSLGLPPGKPVVGMVANFSPVKNHGVFLETAAELTRSGLDLSFLAVGNGPLRETFIRDVHRAGLRDRFHIVRGVNDPARMYRAMTLSMLCSEVEGFPNVLLESMVAGIPCVAPAVGGIPELIEHGTTGLLVQNHSAGEFALAISGLLKKDAMYGRIVEAARARVRANFSIDTMVSNHIELYESLVTRKLGKAA